MCMWGRDKPNWDGSPHSCTGWWRLFAPQAVKRVVIGLESDICYVLGEYQIHKGDGLEKFKARIYQSFSYYLVQREGRSVSDLAFPLTELER